MAQVSDQPGSPALNLARRRSALETLRRFRPRIALTYGLTLVEDLLELSYPWATGVAINGLIEHDWTMAIPIVAAWGLRSAIGLARQMYDTRVYTSIYNTIVEDTILRQRRGGVQATSVAARSAMSREFVTFFEKDVPILVTSMVGIVGSVAILFWYDAIIAGLTASIFLPVYLVNRIYLRYTRGGNEGLNNQLELEVDEIEKADAPALRHHFEQIRCWRVRLSDAEAYNWAFIEVVSVIVFVLILIRATYLPETDSGDIFAILVYVWRFMENIDHIPQIVQQLVRLQDIRKRIEAGASIEDISIEIEREHEQAAEAKL